MKNNNPYLLDIYAILPQLLSWPDTNPASPLEGCSDRQYWAWKLIDFPNGTFQGWVYGLAVLKKRKLLPPYLSQREADRYIHLLFEGASRIRAPNGSYSEAFPNESSFCVSALVAHDLLSAIDILGADLAVATRAQYLDIVRPTIRFLQNQDETHGIISNHLATAIAALIKWNALTGEKTLGRAEQFLNRLLEHSSPEGWFREYEGADPGYQTLALHYLSKAPIQKLSGKTEARIRDSFRFLQYFVHPDGSFGGLYGSRSTQLYYPSAFETWAGESPEAATIAAFMGRSISQLRVPTLRSMDAPNMIPMFNSYCVAAAAWKPHRKVMPLPFQKKGGFIRNFDEAGLIVRKSGAAYSILNYHKGGVVYHFEKDKKHINAGCLYEDRKRRLYTTQYLSPQTALKSPKDDSFIIEQPLRACFFRFPGASDFLILRLLSLTLFRSLLLGRILKKWMAAYLMKPGSSAGNINRRVVQFEPSFRITDALVTSDKSLKLHQAGEFSAQHMASQGYWKSENCL